MDRPEWYQRAIAAERQDAYVEVEGCRIHYASFNQGDETSQSEDKPGIVLLHGSNAHLEWWRFVAPFLTDDFNVVAMDLSGNGDSHWRERYSGELFAKEVMGVAEHAGLGRNPYIVGHSFGGYVTLETAYHFGDQLGGALFCDYTVAAPEQFEEWGNRAEENGPARPTRVYDDLDTALGRFRLMPEQPNQHPYVIDYVGRHSLRQVEGGWTWKFDPALFDYLSIGADQGEKLKHVQCRTAFLLGEHSEDYDHRNIAYTKELTGGKSPIYDIPGTYHHYMFDEPMAVVSAIKGILLSWSTQRVS